MKKTLLMITVFGLLAFTAGAQSRRLNRTKTRPDSARAAREQRMNADAAKDRQRIDQTPDKPNTTKPDGTPSDPTDPANNTNGTSPRKNDMGKQ